MKALSVFLGGVVLSAGLLVITNTYADLNKATFKSIFKNETATQMKVVVRDDFIEVINDPFDKDDFLDLYVKNVDGAFAPKDQVSESPEPLSSAPQLTGSFVTTYGVTAERCKYVSSENGYAPIFDRDDVYDKTSPYPEYEYTPTKDGGNPTYNNNLTPNMDHWNDKKRNINGPSVIYWDDPVHGEHYYMFFAHHEGRSIRLAYADDPCFSNWKVIKNPAFDADINTLSFFNNDKNKQLYDNGIQYYLDDHVASPDVHVVEDTLYMYVHGKPGGGESGQHSLLLSGTGIDTLAANAEDFDNPYLRFFQVNGFSYAVMKNKDGDTSNGLIYQNDDNNYTSNFTKKVSLINNMRHSAVYVDDTHVLLFYSASGDNPERIKFVDLDTKGVEDPAKWLLSNSVDVLKPEETWEGSERNSGASKTGVSYSDVKELRDPAIFIDPKDNQVYLYYSFRGEAGIAAAKLTITKGEENL